MFFRGDFLGEELPDFLKVLKKKDPEYAENLLENYKKNFSDGALPAKTKTLIALALDAGNDDVGGVKALTKQAKKLGATENELLEVVEVVEETCGFQGLATATEALK
ncbi:hypothetical protein AKJ56_01730 [candidate division MSBL1 archaeon SCGC-AAA382N08]|uniref:Carboxymuconolactone decarboxylase-like domain-containing protein n=1 Tax=candidate division MSBL1 archaeon SCGC-AAA382N08 TaxID=1698285 RepID=A0A133VP01_9EURY|nr:hypothetical protein AKJ56_01730 [candidate division MSBL1 archaeon SCGC-AAA382N08]